MKNTHMVSLATHKQQYIEFPFKTSRPTSCLLLAATTHLSYLVLSGQEQSAYHAPKTAIVIPTPHVPEEVCTSLALISFHANSNNISDKGQVDPQDGRVTEKLGYSLFGP